MHLNETNIEVSRWRHNDSKAHCFLAGIRGDVCNGRVNLEGGTWSELVFDAIDGQQGGAFDTDEYFTGVLVNVSERDGAAWGKCHFDFNE